MWYGIKSLERNGESRRKKKISSSVINCAYTRLNKYRDIYEMRVFVVVALRIHHAVLIESFVVQIYAFGTL